MDDSMMGFRILAHHTATGKGMKYIHRNEVPLKITLGIMHLLIAANGDFDGCKQNKSILDLLEEEFDVLLNEENNGNEFDLDTIKFSDTTIQKKISTTLQT
jgi:hypothetical protein